MILAQVWEAIFAQTSTGHSIFSRAFQAQILLGCEASVPQLSKLVHNLHIHAKMGALRTKFKVKIYHGDWDQIFHTFKKWTFWHPLTQKLVKMVMPQYIEGGFTLFSKIHDPHSTTSDRISWLHSYLNWLKCKSVSLYNNAQWGSTWTFRKFDFLIEWTKFYSHRLIFTVILPS